MNILQKINIRGFKAFSEEMSIAFSKLTVLAGSNSVGKSSVIQALLLSFITIEKLIQNDDPSNTVRIPLNGEYHLSLGNTKQITSSSKIFFQLDYIKNMLNLTFDVPTDRNYIQLSEHVAISELHLTSRVHYINAERIGPRVLYDEASQDRFVGYQGEYAVQMLIEGLTFDTPVELNFHKVTQQDGVSLDNLNDQTNCWMHYIIPGIQISADRLREVNRAVASVNSHTLPNVGFGISYVLPIVVAGLIAKEIKEQVMLIVENPEAHLHPSGQSRIGEFLAAVAAQEGVQVIIETHSEHVINGIRVAALKDYIKPSDILVNFLHRDEKNNRKIQIRPIEIKENGEFSSFPPGFFDQAAQDLIQMTKYRMKKK